jgi:fluoroacetyl-CoA thioesterase
MPQTLLTGIVGEAVTAVTADNTAEKLGNVGAPVFATPMLVALMEQAAINAVRAHLACGDGTVGTRVDITHLAATPVGMNVRATARLVLIAGKKLGFDVEAFDDAEIVGRGYHERYIINNEVFFDKVTLKKQKR